MYNDPRYRQQTPPPGYYASPQWMPQQQPPPKTSHTRRLGTILVAGVFLSVVAVLTFGLVLAAFSSELSAPDQAANTTATPQPTPILDAKAAQLAMAIDAANGAVSQPPVKGHWKERTLVIEVTQGTQFDNASAINNGKQDIFYIEQALWQHNGFTAKAIEVDILSPLIDKYGNNSIGPILAATLTSETAHQFVWQNLYPDTAWKVYDDTWIQPSLQQG